MSAGEFLAMVRIANKLPRMSDEEAGRHMKEIGRRFRRQQVIDDMLADAGRG